MNTTRRIHHLIGILAAGACALLALAAASPALAQTLSVPPYGPPASVVPAQVPAQVHTVIAGGMPGWQITLIAVAAALGAATVAVVLDRTRASRRSASATDNTPPRRPGPAWPRWRAWPDGSAGIIRQPRPQVVVIRTPGPAETG